MATSADADHVLAILDEAAAWLTARGIRQWPERWQQPWILPAIDRGETWLALSEHTPLGTMTLSWSDPAWPEPHGDAGYVHQLAVRRVASGLGSHLLAWAAQKVIGAGRGRLRLDCAASNHELRHYYEARGFVHRGDVESCSVIQCLEAGDPLSSLYERVLA
jgi:GNAT superfamily N-acetyltransferase